jgi:hypothetical protein
MRLETLYSVRFEYPEGWAVELDGFEQHFYLAEGRCEGAIAGRFRGANHPVRRADGTFCPDFQGVIETDDGAAVFFDYRGYGRAYPAGRRQIVGFAFHLSDDERFRRLNDAVCACAGEVRTQEGSATVLVLDVAELVWEPVVDRGLRSGE